MDDKYRLFVPFEKIPETAKQALLLYEDRGFYYHPGVNPLSIGRALWDMAGGGRKRGASTITMQLARIVYNIDSSKIGGKALQILRALQIEMFYDDVYKVTKVDMKDFGSPSMQHWQVGGT